MARKIKQTYDLYPTRGDNSNTTFYLPAEDASGNPVGMTTDQVADRATRTLYLRVRPNQSSDVKTGRLINIGVLDYDFTISSSSAIRMRMSEVAPTGTSFIADVLVNGVTIMTTNKLIVEAGELSTETATTAPVLTTLSLSAGDRISVYIIQGGNGGKFPHIWIDGYKT